MSHYDKEKNKNYTPTYWSHLGKYQTDYDRLYKKLVPFQGRAQSEDGELLRCISRFYYDRFNNGHGNSMRREMKVINRFLSSRRDIPVMSITYDIYDHELDKLVDYILKYLIPRHPVPKEPSKDPRAGLATLLLLSQMVKR